MWHGTKALTVAFAASLACSTSYGGDMPVIDPLADCKMVKKTPRKKVVTPPTIVQRLLVKPPAPPASTASAPKRHKHKPKVKVVSSTDEYEVDCPKIVFPKLTSLIPPPDAPVDAPPDVPVAAAAPTWPSDETPTPIPVDTCDCFAYFLVGGGGGGSGGGVIRGGGGGGGGAHGGAGPVTPVPEPATWACVAAGLALLGIYRRRTT